MRKEPEILPNLKPLNIAEAPKTAVSAVLKASLGEDKYAGMNSWKPDKKCICTGICASSKGVGNTWQQFFAGVGEVKMIRLNLS